MLTGVGKSIIFQLHLFFWSLFYNVYTLILLVHFDRLVFHNSLCITLAGFL